MKVQGLPTVSPQFQTQKASPKGNFSSLIKQYTQDVNHQVKDAAKAAEALAIDGQGSVSETMLAVQKANLSFQLMMTARTKVLDAYREVMRMQV